MAVILRLTEVETASTIKRLHGRLDGMGAAHTFIPFFLFIAAWSFAWQQLSKDCTFHGHHAAAALGPVPFLFFATYCCWRVLLVYWAEAKGEGGISVWFYRFGHDRFDFILLLQLFFWVMCVGGFARMMTAPPLPSNCAYAYGPEVAAFEFSPCLACCSCLEQTQDTMRCGFDYCDQAILTPQQRWEAAADEMYSKVKRAGCQGLPSEQACEELALKEGRRAYAELREREAGGSSAAIAAAGEAHALTKTPTPAPTPPTMMPTAFPTPDVWDAAEEHEERLAAIATGTMRPSPVCWGTGQRNTDSLLKGTRQSALKKCGSSTVWYKCVFNNWYVAAASCLPNLPTPATCGMQLNLRPYRPRPGSAWRI